MSLANSKLQSIKHNSRVSYLAHPPTDDLAQQKNEKGVLKFQLEPERVGTTEFKANEPDNRAK